MMGKKRGICNPDASGGTKDEGRDLRETSSTPSSPSSPRLCCSQSALCSRLLLLLLVLLGCSWCCWVGLLGGAWLRGGGPGCLDAAGLGLAHGRRPLMLLGCHEAGRGSLAAALDARA